MERIVGEECGWSRSSCFRDGNVCDSGSMAVSMSCDGRRGGGWVTEDDGEESRGGGGGVSVVMRSRWERR